MAMQLGAKICGAETCYLSTVSPDANPKNSKMSLSLKKNVKFLKKMLNCKKLRPRCWQYVNNIIMVLLNVVWPECLVHKVAGLLLQACMVLTVTGTVRGLL